MVISTVEAKQGWFKLPTLLASGLHLLNISGLHQEGRVEGETTKIAED